MPASHVVGLGLLGLVVGILGTLIGAGGGFILLPILIFLYPHDSPAVLTATSLSVVFANATSGSIAYARMRRIDFRAGLLFALAGLPGAILGALLTHRMNHRLFDPLLGGMLLVAAAIVLFRPPYESRVEAGTGTVRLVEANGTVHVYTPRIATGMLFSVVVGFVSSLLGIGGGIIHVPLMVYVLGFPTHVSTATSHFVLALLLSLAAVIVHLQSGSLGPVLVRTLPIIAGVLVGAQGGAWLSSRLHGRWIMRGLAIALACVGVRLLAMR